MHPRRVGADREVTGVDRNLFVRLRIVRREAA
jgi:hypothetical protein